MVLQFYDKLRCCLEVFSISVFLSQVVYSELTSQALEYITLMLKQFNLFCFFLFFCILCKLNPLLFMGCGLQRGDFRKCGIFQQFEAGETKINFVIFITEF